MTRLALAALAVAALYMLLGRRGARPGVPAAMDDDQYVPMAAWSPAVTSAVRCTCGMSVPCGMHVYQWTYTGGLN